MEKRAIIHVDNTENVLELAEYLSSSGWTLVSADKTEELLRKHKIPVINDHSISESNIFMNDASHLIQSLLLSRYIDPSEADEFISQKEAKDNNIYLVCINIYPVMNQNLNVSSEKMKEIYSPKNFYCSTLLRNSFRNYENVLILTDPADYKEAIIQLKTENISDDFRLYLAGKALNLISAYDSGLAASILHHQKNYPYFMNYFCYPLKKDAYIARGSNAHQQACIYRFPNEFGTLGGFSKIQGREIDYNTLVDIYSAWEQISSLYSNLKNQLTVKSTNSDGYEFTTQFTPLTGTIFTVAVKFGITVGASLSSNLINSFYQTHIYDTENIKDAVFGSSAVIDAESAKKIVVCDFSAIVAPSFTEEALSILSENKRIRIVPAENNMLFRFEGRIVDNGFLVQTADTKLFDHWNVKTKNRPSQYKTDEMAFGMQLAMYSRSYCAVLIKHNSVIALAQGCSSVPKAIGTVFYDARETAARLKERAIKENCPTDPASDTLADILVCDSAILFNDDIKQLIDCGITAIIQTGGTPTDNEFINYCDERGVVMVFTDSTHIRL